VNDAFEEIITLDVEKIDFVTGGLKVLNLGGIKMPTSTAFDSRIKGCTDAEMGGLSHVERTTRSGIEHQRDCQGDRIQPQDSCQVYQLGYPSNRQKEIA
jgi:hypothetical protein